jgi:hypothetical protein
LIIDLATIIIRPPVPEFPTAPLPVPLFCPPAPPEFPVPPPVYEPPKLPPLIAPTPPAPPLIAPLTFGLPLASLLSNDIPPAPAPPEKLVPFPTILCAYVLFHEFTDKPPVPPEPQHLYVDPFLIVLTAGTPVVSPIHQILFGLLLNKLVVAYQISRCLGAIPTNLPGACAPLAVILIVPLLVKVSSTNIYKPLQRLEDINVCPAGMVKFLNERTKAGPSCVVVNHEA